MIPERKDQKINQRTSDPRLEPIKKSKLSYRQQKIVLGVMFSLPALILLFIFLILPALLAFYYSFTDYAILKPDQINFVGLENYNVMLSDNSFYNSLKNTLYFVAIIVPLQSGTALGLALLVNKKVKLASLGRVFFFSPVVTSMVVVAILWTFLYNVENGIINEVLNSFGIPSQPFLLSENQAMDSIIFMSNWQAAGFQMIIFLAGLKEIPEELYEAAEIDGANSWQKFKSVTLPSLYHVTGFVIVITTIQAFRLFVQPFVMTNGGPMESTKTLVLLLFEQGFAFGNVGYSSAIAIVFFGVVLSISLVIKRLIIRE